jgi:hypothetical protein
MKSQATQLIREDPLTAATDMEKPKIVTHSQPPATKREELVWKRFFYEHQIQQIQHMVDLLDEAISHV